MKARKAFWVALALSIFAAATAWAGNAHQDGASKPNILQFFAPVRNNFVTQTKADKTYTPTAGTKLIMIQPTAAVTMKINGTGTGFPLAANADFGPIGLATRAGVGVSVSSIVFTGASSATKTIHILEQ